MADETLDTQDVEITIRDIVFDCPNCGHNLVVDYRAAGLSVPCPECHAIIYAPIPEELHLEDLDCDPGELLQQLLQTRRMLNKAQIAGQQAGEKVVEQNEQLSEARAALRAMKARVETLQEAATLITDTCREILEAIATVSGK